MELFPVKILIIEDKADMQFQIACELFFVLSEEFRILTDEGEKRTYIANHQGIVLKYATSLAETFEFLPNNTDVDLITLDGIIGPNSDEAGAEVLEYLDTHYPYLLKKILIIAGDTRIINRSLKHHKIPGILKQDPMSEARDAFQKYVPAIIQNN